LRIQRASRENLLSDEFSSADLSQIVSCLAPAVAY
jgi:hypothetical protein